MRSSGIIVLLLTCIMGILLLTACAREMNEHEMSKLKLQDNLKYTKTSDPVKIEDLFLIPTTLDYILREEPEVLEKYSRKDTVLNEFESKTGLHLDRELKKYLERKKIYSRSSIFSDVP